MNDFIHNHHVLPLVGTIPPPFPFNKCNFGDIKELKLKMKKLIDQKDVKELAKYLAFCMQEWATPNECPIDRTILTGALSIIKEYYH